MRVSGRSLATRNTERNWQQVALQAPMVLHATSLGTSKASYEGGGRGGNLLAGEMGDFAVAYRGDVAAGDQELHDLGAFAGELGPARRGCGILLEGADALSGEVEIDLG